MLLSCNTLRNVNLRLYGEVGLEKIKDAGNVILCQLIINQHETVYVDVYWMDGSKILLISLQSLFESFRRIGW